MAIYRVVIYFFGVLQLSTSQLQYVIKYDLPQEQAMENVDELCAAQMEMFISALENFDFWAITMLDSTSKIPVGLLTGNINDMGNFDECIGVEHHTDNITIKGKHCGSGLNIPLGALLQSPTILGQKHLFLASELTSIYSQIPRADQTSDISLSLSLCIPNACNPTDLSSYINLEGVVFNDGQCQTSEKQNLDGSDIAAVTFLLIILASMAASTIYDVYLYKTDGSSFHPVLLAFSVFTNGRKLITVNDNDRRQLTSLHGLRCISMVWIVAGHRYAGYARVPAMNAIEIVEWPSYLYTQYIQSAAIAVDTFFFLSGMMISYGLFKEKNKPKGVSFIPLYYLHRYLRITPAAGALYFVSVTVWRHVASGPLWMGTGMHMRDSCLKWWWSYFLYLQNYVNYFDLCIPSTWYLSVDMQMFLLSPFIFIPLGYIMVKTSMKAVYGCCASLVLLFMVIEVTIKFTVETRNTSMTQDRLSVWMVGFTIGILLQEVKSRNSQIILNRILNLVIWAVILIGMIAILLTMHDVNQNPEEVRTNMFDTFHRPAWGLGLSWIVFSCTIGYGGFVNWFLSLPAFQVLSRLTYCMYLVHILCLSFVIGQARTVWYFTEFNIFYAFCGDIICTTILALFWTLAFGSPMIIIEKYIFGRNGASKTKDLKQPLKEELEKNVSGSKMVPAV